MNFYYVYILLCSDGLTYTGITNDIARRFNEHQKGVRNTVGLFQVGAVLEMIDFKTQCPVERSRDLV
ncbi:GIY-YIG nuclease family protein [Maribacter sp. ANRC-HE7]|uniref:GIY-YIG nuclease family protein n=1 Tax=Maribacter aquimaris TaxID=2737171 RepID=A0ABR7V3Z3_9FLAO|nr:GIY-YIG nuclease family protein [Maribacter aquimaris]MBD0779534.1 GIY-YIG nuclease family protein [Maribacter aquimaris]